MRQKDFLPCNCKKCYFCKNGHIKGEEYIMHYKCGKRIRQERCTDTRVTIANNSSYCRPCYKKQPNTKSSAEKKFGCSKSRMGCGSCKEPVCAACWETYDHGVTL